MLTNWQRIEQVIKWTGCASVSAFASEIGLKRSENLYQIKRGNNGISKDLADSISVKYPQVSKAWLLTGEGDMLHDVNTAVKHTLPLFKEDAVTLLGEEIDSEKTKEFISFPTFKDCDFAAFSFTDAMEPDVPRGAMLIFQRIMPQEIIPGEMYLVKSRTFKGIRFIRTDSASKKIRLVPRKLAEYDEIIIEQADIETLYIVRGIVINKSI